MAVERSTVQVDLTPLLLDLVVDLAVAVVVASAQMAAPITKLHKVAKLDITAMPAATLTQSVIVVVVALA